MFWKTAERGRLERFKRGLFLPVSTDTSAPAETHNFLSTKAEDRYKYITPTLTNTGTWQANCAP